MIETIIKWYYIIPLILLLVTIFLVVNGANKLKKCDECNGIIVRFYENTSEILLSSYETKAISPVVSYSVNGKNYEFIGNYYSTNMRVGDNVKVLYNKNDHSKASVKAGAYFAPIITGGLTIVFVIPIILIAVLRSKNIINF